MTHAMPDAGADTRQRLMEAALLAFAEKGYDGVGLREIAQMARANPAMIAYHFGGKQGLYEASLRWVFSLGSFRVENLPFPPEPGAPDFRPRALEAFGAHIRGFLDDLMACHVAGGGPLSEELARAAHTVWSREMEDPRPSMQEFILSSIRPYMDHLRACLVALRPDLDERQLEFMALSIHGQLLFVHKNMRLIALVRGGPITMQHLDEMANHFITFSLRGLGVPEAFPIQGA